jgi:hypothetical protein
LESIGGKFEEDGDLKIGIDGRLLEFDEKIHILD